MDIIDLDAFPNLKKAYQTIEKPPALDNCFIANHLKPYLKWEIPSMRLNQAEEALSALRDRIDELEEQIKDLFHPETDEWGKATTELIGYMELNQLGILADIGYPKNIGSPPFDGQLKVGGGESILFDIKSAANSGFWLLQSECEKHVQEWALKNNLSKVTTLLNYVGPITQEVVGKNLRNTTKNLQKYLNGLTTIPSEPIPINKIVSIRKLPDGDKIESTKILISIQKDNGVNVQGGTEGLASHYIKETIKGHIEGKGKQALKFATPYILIYVRPKMCGGSDIKNHDLFSVVSDLYYELSSTHEKWFQLWLGVVLFDWTSDPKVVCREGIFFEDADWPSGSTHETVARSLDIPAPRTISAQ